MNQLIFEQYLTQTNDKNIYILMICTLFFSCTNTETGTETATTIQIAEDQSEESLTAVIEEKAEEIKEEVQEIETIEIQTKEKTISKTQVTNTKQSTSSSSPSYSSGIIIIGTVEVNTVFMTEEEVAQFNEADNDLAAIKYEFQLPSADDVAALRQMLDDLVDEVEGFVGTEDTTTQTKVKTGAFDEVISGTKSGKDVTDETIKDANTINKTSLEYIRRPKPLVDYSDYKIELMTVFNKSLDLNDPLFKAFGGLMFKNNTMNSITYYLGNFKDTDALNDYLQKVVKARFPKAKGAKFEKGLEVKYN